MIPSPPGCPSPRLLTLPLYQKACCPEPRCRLVSCFVSLWLPGRGASLLLSLPPSSLSICALGSAYSRLLQLIMECLKPPLGLFLTINSASLGVNSRFLDASSVCSHLHGNTTTAKGGEKHGIEPFRQTPGACASCRAHALTSSSGSAPALQLPSPPACTLFSGGQATANCIQASSNDFAAYDDFVRAP